jgi:type VI secretion system secreted protein Hcp
MATDIYLLIDGIKGEATDSVHKDQIELSSASFGMEQPGSATQASFGGGTSSRCKHEDFTVTAFPGLHSPKVYDAVSSGLHISKCTAHWCRASGDASIVWLEMVMENCVLSSVKFRHDAITHLPVETISITYGSVKYTYTQQTKPGKKGGNVAGGWNLEQNKAAS